MQTMRRDWFARVLLGGAVLLAVARLISAAPASAPQQSQTLQVAGAVEKPGAWTAAQLAKTFASELRTVRYTIKGQTETARCVPLLSVINAAEPRLNPKRKNHLLACVVVARAEDGYAVSFSLGELLPEQGKREVWIALDRNGRPLPEEEAPARLIVPGEQRPARWIYGLHSLTLLDGAQLTAKTEEK